MHADDRRAAGPGRHPPLRLGAPPGRLDEEFDVLVHARELADGRVLIPEARGRGLLVADFVRQTVVPIGRKGRGPGEYEFPGQGHALGGDSTLVMDLLVRRWLVLHGATIVRTLPPDDPAIVATQGGAAAADSLGRLLKIGTLPLEGARVITTRDSSVAILIDRATGRPDTIARLRRRPLREWRETDATGRVVRSGSAPTTALTAQEIGTLFGDGWVAIVRLDPFRVDWRRPDGTWLRGAPLPVPVIRNSARERAARVRRTPPAASRAATPPMPRPTGTAGTLPPFDHGQSALLPASDGRLLIRRTPSADFEGTRYLVVNRAGRLEGELTLPANWSLIGFDRASAYVAELDASEVAHLVRYAWPPR